MNDDNRRSLPVELTAEERASKALQLASICQDIDDTESAAKVAASGFKEKIKLLQADQSSLASCVRTGKEYRPVDVYKRQNLTLRTWEIRRGDTGELVESKAMTDWEYREATQEKLPWGTSGSRVESSGSSVPPFAEPVTVLPPVDEDEAPAKRVRVKATKLHPAPLTATVAELAEATACINVLCGVPLEPGASRRGRCRPCADFYRRHKTERHAKKGPVVDDTTSPAGAA